MFFGIYGFNFKEPIHCDGYTLIPLSVSDSKVATDSRLFHLTGYMEINATDTINKVEEIIFEVSSYFDFYLATIRYYHIYSI